MILIKEGQEQTTDIPENVVVTGEPAKIIRAHDGPSERKCSKMDNLTMDRHRYKEEKMPRFQYYFRKAQQGGLLRQFYRYLFYIERQIKHIDLSVSNHIGGDLFRSCIWYNHQSESYNWGKLQYS